MGFFIVLEVFFEFEFVQFALDFHFYASPVGGLESETGVFQYELYLVTKFFEVLLRLAEHIFDLLLDLVLFHSLIYGLVESFPLFFLLFLNFVLD